MEKLAGVHGQGHLQNTKNFYLSLNKLQSLVAITIPEVLLFLISYAPKKSRPCPDNSAKFSTPPDKSGFHVTRNSGVNGSLAQPPAKPLRIQSNLMDGSLPSIANAASSANCSSVERIFGFYEDIQSAIAPHGIKFSDSTDMASQSIKSSQVNSVPPVFALTARCRSILTGTGSPSAPRTRTKGSVVRPFSPRMSLLPRGHLDYMRRSRRCR